MANYNMPAVQIHGQDLVFSVTKSVFKTSSLSFEFFVLTQIAFVHFLILLPHLVSGPELSASDISLPKFPPTCTSGFHHRLIQQLFSECSAGNSEGVQKNLQSKVLGREIHILC